MYDKHAKKKCIQLWCYTGTLRNRVQKEVSGDTSGSLDDHTSDVDAVYEKLRDKHKSFYDEEQLRM